MWRGFQLNYPHDVLLASGDEGSLDRKHYDDDGGEGDEKVTKKNLQVILNPNVTELFTLQR